MKWLWGLRSIGVDGVVEFSHGFGVCFGRKGFETRSAFGIAIS
jgi:hypothetical protein